ncbi:MAG TPA: N4-gp56 family major capsid protein [Limosilactobacillus coleohominis]|nr:N4-gp56 family major capsid protein [Limosilactobacillus coleohominis]
MATPSPTNYTHFADMLDPQVLSPMIGAQLAKLNVFSSIAPADTTLEGKPGDTITIPKYKYTGSARVYGEGEQLDFDSLEYTTQSVKIKKIVSAYSISDEAALIPYGDPRTEAARQMSMALATYVDDDILNVAKTAPIQVSGHTPDQIDLVDDLEEKFATATNAVEGATFPQQGVLYVSYKDAAALRKAAGDNWTRASELGDDVLINGAFGELLGWEIIRTAKLTAGHALAVKPGAMKTYLKRAPLVYSWYDGDHQINKASTTEYLATAIYNDALLATVGFAGGSTGTTTKDDKQGK